jgi:hypothetical protein
LEHEKGSKEQLIEIKKRNIMNLIDINISSLNMLKNAVQDYNRADEIQYVKNPRILKQASKMNHYLIQKGN